MRTVRFSKTFANAFDAHIADGEQEFGPDVARQKRRIVTSTITGFLARHPETKQIHPSLGLVVYPIAKTPFFILYDFDDAELRVHFVFIKGKPLNDIDPASVEW